MKVIAFNGSARKGGNTEQMIKVVFGELRQAGIDTELVHLGGLQIRSCLACMQCTQNRDEECIFKNDQINDFIQQMKSADGIILASPSYFANVSSELKAFIDRVGLVAKANGDLFRRKLGAAIGVSRRSGEVFVFDAINHFFLINQMIVVGSSYWNNAIGLQPGDVQNDEEGISTMKNLGRNMAWLLQTIHT
jgi:multimeric flavodoxin WrbA